MISFWFSWSRGYRYLCSAPSYKCFKTSFRSSLSPTSQTQDQSWLMYVCVSLPLSLSFISGCSVSYYSPLGFLLLDPSSSYPTPPKTLLFRYVNFSLISSELMPWSSTLISLRSGSSFPECQWIKFPKLCIYLSLNFISSFLILKYPFLGVGA